VDDSFVIDPFFRSLAKQLNEVLADRMMQLSQGSASQITGEVATTGEKYAAQCSYIKAINDVLSMGQEIQKRQAGLQ
jgi:hypothetical protein